MATVLLVRHAAAEEASAGMTDGMRPLSSKGEREMERIAASIASQLPDAARIVSSPLLRAVQTAEILAHAYGKIPLITTTALAPGGDPESIARFLREPPAEAPPGGP